jgi:hypothetical protein
LAEVRPCLLFGARGASGVVGLCVLFGESEESSGVVGPCLVFGKRGGARWCCLSDVDINAEREVSPCKSPCGASNAWDSVATVAIATSASDSLSFPGKHSLYTSYQDGAHVIMVLQTTYQIETDVSLVHGPGRCSSTHLAAGFLKAV